jgi:hypothetical protein
MHGQNHIKKTDTLFRTNNIHPSVKQSPLARETTSSQHDAAPNLRNADPHSMQ